MHLLTSGFRGLGLEGVYSEGPHGQLIYDICMYAYIHTYVLVLVLGFVDSYGTQ